MSVRRRFALFLFGVAVGAWLGRGPRSGSGPRALWRPSEGVAAEAALPLDVVDQSTRATDSIQAHEQVAQASVRDNLTDALTGLANRRAFDYALGSEVERAIATGSDLGVVLIDLDSFTRVNHAYGYQQGDVVLREVARVLRDGSCDTDVVARYGGQEFVLVLPGSDLEATLQRAERIAQEVSRLQIARIHDVGTIGVTVSCGCAWAHGWAADGSGLLQAAHVALCEAKRRGDDDPQAGVREPRRPDPDRGTGGLAVPLPDPPRESDNPKPPDARWSPSTD